ncbi:MAG: HAD family hydrolase, partial [Phycisphaerae bacterium]|nr:HAD family hydrolase [Phycisphaerae bacterium]
MLLLFDIDGTLLRTQGVGVAAMAEALRELHDGREFS